MTTDTASVPRRHEQKPWLALDRSASNKKTILVVGGLRPWFQELQLVLQHVRPSWGVKHALTVDEAACLLPAVSWDALVYHPDVTSQQQVGLRAPEAHSSIVHVPLCTKRSTTSVGSAPTFQTHAEAGADAAATVESIVRTLYLEDWITRPAIKTLLPLITKLPALPKLHGEIIRELQSPDGSLETVSQLVRHDPMMSAKFLQIVNSSLFGLEYRVADPGEAVMYLGVIRTRALVLMSGVFSQFDSVRCPGTSAEQIWDHSQRVASLAQGIALSQTEDPRLTEMAFTAGLLHDIGKLVLAGNVPEMYATAHKFQLQKRTGDSEAEMVILGTTHAEFGGCLLAIWHLPLPIIEAVWAHHAPALSHDTAFSVLTAVHAGNVLAHETEGARPGFGLPSRFDLMYLIRLGLSSKRNAWREACGIPVRDEEDSLEENIRRRAEARRN
jgi:HD-like signal output (HDOD) protein